MPKLRLTDAAVKRTKAAGQQIDYWDDLTTGFGLRISKTGTRAWIVITRAWRGGERKLVRVTLGNYPDMKLAEARGLAKAALIAAQEGKDPREVKKRAQEVRETVRRGTYAAVRKEFLEKYRTRKKSRPAPRTLAEMTRCLSSDRVKDWEDRLIGEITKQDVRDVLDAIMADGHEVLANRTLTYFTMLFQWAAKRDLITHIPTEAIDPPGTETKRERVLTAPELAKVWLATAPTQQKAVPDVFGRIVRVLILTGQRRNEVAGMKWAELDLNDGLWSIPSSRTKNKLPHLVPLSAPVVEILEQARDEQDNFGKSKLVFTSNGKTPFSGWSRSKARLDGRAKLKESWTLHDLRRSMVTAMNEEKPTGLGMAPHVVESAVNHVSGTRGGVAGVYNKAQYLNERRAAFDAWAVKVLTAVQTSSRDNVMEIAR